MRRRPLVASGPLPIHRLCPPGYLWSMLHCHCTSWRILAADAPGDLIRCGRSGCRHEWVPVPPFLTGWVVLKPWSWFWFSPPISLVYPLSPWCCLFSDHIVSWLWPLLGCSYGLPLLYPLCPYPTVAVYYACQLIILSYQSAVLAEFVVFFLLLYYYLLK